MTPAYSVSADTFVKTNRQKQTRESWRRVAEETLNDHNIWWFFHGAASAVSRSVCMPADCHCCYSLCDENQCPTVNHSSSYFVSNYSLIISWYCKLIGIQRITKDNTASHSRLHGSWHFEISDQHYSDRVLFNFRPGNGSPSATNVVVVLLVVVIIRFSICQGTVISQLIVMKLFTHRLQYSAPGHHGGILN